MTVELNTRGSSVLTAIKTVDGTGSGLDADLVDGNEASALLARANHTGSQTASTISDFDSAVAATASVTANTAKVTNATHTGDATGATALTLQPSAITGKSDVTVAGSDLLVVTDVSASPQALGKVTAQSIADLRSLSVTDITGQSADSPMSAAAGDLLLAVDVSSSPLRLVQITAQSIAALAGGGVENPLTADLDVGGFKLVATGTDDIVFKLPDNAGVRKFSIQDSDNAERFWADSDGRVGFHGRMYSYGHGTEALPAYSFDISGNKAYGMWYSGGSINFSINGVLLAGMSSAGLKLSNATETGSFPIFGHRRVIHNRTTSGAENHGTNGAVVTNAGAGAGITKTLPSAIAGLHMFFVDANTGGFRLTVVPNTGDEIEWIDGTIVSQATGSLVSTARGDSCYLVALDVTRYKALHATGTWTVTP